jgi:hypothetical protein
MKCKGNHAETCGGPNRLDVYQLVSPTSPTPSQTITSSSTQPASTSSPVQPTASAGTGKRGLAYSTGNPEGDAIFANFFTSFKKITWAYDWGYPAHGLDPSFELYVEPISPCLELQTANKYSFSVPMLWGLPSGPDPSWTAAVQTPGTKYILGFNEPDLTYSGSSNIIPAKAAAGYQEYIEPFSGSAKVGMPNVLWNNVGSSSGGDYDTAVWTQYFVGNCTSCHFDFMGIHYYQDCDPADGQSGAAWFQGNVTNAYETCKLPVWITEFQCYGTDAQQVAFLQEVLPWLDSQSYVQRYAYFGAFPDFLMNANGTGLSEIGVAYATT